MTRNIKTAARTILAATALLALSACGGAATASPEAAPAEGTQIEKPSFADAELFFIDGVTCLANRTGQGSVALSCAWGKPGVVSENLPAKPSFADAETYAVDSNPCVSIRSRQGSVATSCGWGYPGYLDS